jgi:hypothetical protein
MPSATESGRERMLQAILSRAAVDPIFRAGLLAEPKRAINEAFGIAIPAQLRIRFIEKDADLDALVVLPDRAPTSGELNEHQLETANGGQGDAFELGFDIGDLPW